MFDRSLDIAELKKKLLIRFDRMKYAFQKTFPCKFPLTTLNVKML